MKCDPSMSIASPPVCDTITYNAVFVFLIGRHTARFVFRLALLARVRCTPARNFVGLYLVGVQTQLLRVAKKDFTVTSKGRTFTVPKGHYVGTSPYLAMHLPEVFTNPDEVRALTLAINKHTRTLETRRNRGLACARRFGFIRPFVTLNARTGVGMTFLWLARSFSF